jgi:hypothetical protein
MNSYFYGTFGRTPVMQVVMPSLKMKMGVYIFRRHLTVVTYTESEKVLDHLLYIFRGSPIPQRHIY